jgi:PAS domain S-box-containing protein
MENDPYRLLFEHTRDGFLLTDPEGRIIEWNPALTSITGLAREVALGQYIWDVERLMDIPASKLDYNYNSMQAGYQKFLQTGHSPWENGTLPMGRFEHHQRGEYFTEANFFAIAAPTGYQIGCVVRDVTFRYARQNKDYLRGRALEASANAIVITDPRGIVEYANPAFTRMTGYTQGDILGQNLRVVKSHLQDENIYQDMWDTIANGNIWKGTLTNLRKDGSPYTEEMTITPVLSPNNFITNYIAIQQDVSERSRLLAELHDRETLLRTLFESMREGLSIVDENDVFLFANPEAHRIFGVSPDSLVGRHLDEFLPPASKAIVAAQTEHRRQGQSSVYEHEVLRPDGGLHQVLVTATPREETHQSYSGAVAVFRDITERKQVEMALKRSEAIYRGVVGNAHDAIAVIDKDGIIIDWNPAMAVFSGIAGEKALGHAVADVLPHLVRPDLRTPEFLSTANQTILNVLRGGETAWMTGIFEWSFIHPDGSERFAEQTSHRIETEDGYLLCVIIRDVTRRKKAEYALQESNNRFRLAYENANTGMMLIDLQGVIFQANHKMSEILGYSQSEIVGMTVNTLAIPEDMDISPRLIKRALAEKMDSFTFEKRYYHKDGHIIHGLISDSLVRDARGEPLYFIAQIQDISELKQVDRLRTLNEISTTVTSTLEPQQVVQEVLEIISRTTHAGSAYMLRLLPQSGELVFEATLAHEADNLVGRHISIQTGVAGWVVRNRRSIHVSDAHQDTRFDNDFDNISRSEAHSMICAPLIYKDEVRGVIQLINAQQGDFSTDDLELLEAAASIASVAMENARLFDDLRSRARELEVLNSVSQALAVSLHAGTIIESTLQQFLRLFQTELILHIEINPVTQKARLHKFAGSLSPAALASDELPSLKMLPFLFEKRQAELIPCMGNDERMAYWVERFPELGRGSLMLVPIFSAEKSLTGKASTMIGVLLAVRLLGTAYTLTDLRMMESISAMMAVSLENARLYENLRQALLERERTQNQLIQSEKVSALGRLAASLAHEINNPLQAVKGCLSLFDEEMQGQRDERKLAQYIDIVRSEIERVVVLVRGMREFYRPGKQPTYPTFVDDVLENVLTLTAKQMRINHIDIQTLLIPNLPAVNAAPDHLKQIFMNLILNAIDAMPEGGKLTISTDLVKANKQFASPMCVIQFSDSGHGMPPEVLDHLFEPFFTTKENGSGLGLYVSYGIIDSYGGKISVTSQVSEGTTFTILLPVAGEKDA